MKNKEWLNNFGDFLAKKIYEAGYTQDEFASLIGVSPATISKYINKTQMPGIKVIINISRVLDCEYGELIDFGGTNK